MAWKFENVSVAEPVNVPYWVTAPLPKTSCTPLAIANRWTGSAATNWLISGVTPEVRADETMASTVG